MIVPVCLHYMFAIITQAMVCSVGTYADEKGPHTMTTHQTQSNSALYQWLSTSVQK